MNEIKFQSVEMCDVKRGNLEIMVESLAANHKQAEEERKRDLDKIYTKLEEYGNRLPNWATLLIGGLASVAGAAIAHAWK